MKRKKADYVAHRFDASAFEQYRSKGRQHVGQVLINVCRTLVWIPVQRLAGSGVEVDKKGLLIRSFKARHY